MAEGRLWEKILRDSAHKIRYEESHLVLVGRCHPGEQGAGIKSLLTALQTGPGAFGKVRYSELEPSTAAPAPQVSPLLYSYLNVKNIEDVHSEKISKMNIWAVSDFACHSLLDQVLRPTALKNMVFAVVLDFSRPWNFMASLREWLDCWNSKVGRAVSALPLAEQDELVARVTDYMRKFSNPSGEVPPLPEGVLTINMGVPIVFICNKSDLCWQVDKSRDVAEEKLDFVVRSLRTFALTCMTHADGAGIVYTSAKTGDNVNILYEYLMHRVYGFHFQGAPQVLSRESIFIPAGWDSTNLISELDYIKCRDRQYEDVLPAPRTKDAPREEVKYENDQEFLRSVKEKIVSVSRGPVSASQKRDRDRKPEKPNPGDVVEVVVETTTRNQSTLEKFYKDLLDKGTKDQSSKLTEA